MPSPVEDSIASIILRNNLLQLPEEEVRSLATTLSQCSGDKEVRDWCTTLMVADADVEAILVAIKNRNAPTATAAPPAAAALPSLPTTAAKATASSINVISKTKKRGANTNALKKDATDSKGLATGKFFECGCFATQHDFVTNCLNCGRIFCAQELPTAAGGSYAAQAAGVSAETTLCYFCGMPPTENVAESLQVSAGDSTAQAQKANLDSAILRRDQLLAFASDKKRRTTVVDDQHMGAMIATGQSTTWLSDQELEHAGEVERRERIANLHRSTNVFKVHIDIVNQALSLGAVPTKEVDTPENLVEEASPEADEAEEDAQRIEPMPKMLQRIWYTGDTTAPPAPKEEGPKKSAHRTTKTSVRIQNDYYADDQLQYTIQLQERLRAPPEPAPQPATPSPPSNLSRQEEQLRELKLSEDVGMCMTLHQPYASLLVAGIMTHEGRSWPSDFKGRLWIHAAASEPTDIPTTEAHYKKYASPDAVLPKQYPTSCLLGCVTVSECISKEEYEARYPEEQRQSGSEFVFLCSNAKKLPFALPMTGKHKIYRMDKKMWASAKKQLGEA